MDLSRADIQTMVATFWDGESVIPSNPGGPSKWNIPPTTWTSDDEFGELCAKGHKVECDGSEYVITRRNAFSDSDCQHVIQTRALGGSSGLVFAHCRRTLIVAKFDPSRKVENGYELVPSPVPMGPASRAVQQVAEYLFEEGL